MNKDLEKLKKIIVEAVPEIMEKCERCKGSGRIYDGETIDAKCNGTGKILGRPITLEDVLRAMQGYQVQLDNEWASNTLVFTFDEKAKPIREAWWELGKSLDNQTPEVWKFLLEVLSK